MADKSLIDKLELIHTALGLLILPLTKADIRSGAPPTRQ
jgi:hypothetical protein